MLGLLSVDFILSSLFSFSTLLLRTRNRHSLMSLNVAASKFLPNSLQIRPLLSWRKRPTHKNGSLRTRHLLICRHLLTAKPHFWYRFDWPRCCEDSIGGQSQCLRSRNSLRETQPSFCD